MKVLYKTSDDIQFYHEQDAKNHALSLKDRKIEKIGATEVKSAALKEKKSAAELIDEIEQVETLEALEAYAGYKQATVIKAVEAKREALTTNIEGDLDGTDETETE